MKKIKTMIKTEFEKTLSENKKLKKPSASHMAGKLLLLFFVLMLVFTIVSRVLASITVARVTVSNPQRDRLVYSISGTGEIIPEGEKRLLVLPGYRIDEVYVKVGEEVDVGTALYSYRMMDLQDKYSSIENEIKKIELLIAEERLRQLPSEAKPSKAAILSLKQAKENLEVANTRLDEAQKDYENSRNSTKEKLLENKKKEYEAAVKSYETLINSKEKQLMLAERAVEDATTALEQAGETKSKIKRLIDNYKDTVLSKDKLTIYLAEEDIFEDFYGGAEVYEEHKDEIYTKVLAVMGEGFYLWNLQDKILYYEKLFYTFEDELQKILSSTDPSVNSEQNRRTLDEKYKDAINSYYSYLEEYERIINFVEGSYKKESDELKRLRRNDKQLKDYLIQFCASIEDGVDHEAQEKKLYDFMYGDQQKEIELDVKKRTLARTRAGEDYKLLVKEFEMARNDLQAENTELKNVIKSIEDGTYDYEEALEGKRQDVEAAREAVRIAKQTVEMHNLKEDAPIDQNSKQIYELEIQSHTIDLNIKEQALEEVRILMEGSGEVRSIDKGVATFVGVEAGSTTTGEEMIKLGFGDYVFRAAFDREAVANIAAGVTANIYLAGNKTGIELEIEQITISENGMSEITARMPEDKYIFGEQAGFKITTQSEQFDLCIPIQALREDNYGYYVLIVREQEDILGTQLIAERINVTIIDKGSRTVAVDGAISSKSQVITDSNKYINAGDRIRIDY
jgi:hypothetical protein